MEKEPSDHECMICFQILNKPRECSTCKKNLCSVHVLTLDRCPHCRAHPFVTTVNHPLEQTLHSIREAKRKEEIDTTNFRCYGKNCKVSGNYRTMLRHHQKVHPYLPLDMILYGDYYEIQEGPQVTDPTEFQRGKAEYAVENVRPPPAGDVKKIVSYALALRMVRHCSICPNNQCLCMYSGPWGTFIGGSEGRTHFDLTSCTKGRQLNETAGWNYGNPRR